MRWTNIFFLIVLASLAGCQTYRADLNLPAKISSVKIQPITTKSDSNTRILTIALQNHVDLDFTETGENLIISGSANVRGFLAPDYVDNAIIEVIDANGRRYGYIECIGGWILPDSPVAFARQIAKILKKNQKKP